MSHSDGWKQERTRPRHTHTHTQTERRNHSEKQAIFYRHIEWKKRTSGFQQTQKLSSKYHLYISRATGATLTPKMLQMPFHSIRLYNIVDMGPQCSVAHTIHTYSVETASTMCTYWFRSVVVCYPCALYRSFFFFFCPSLCPCLGRSLTHTNTHAHIQIWVVLACMEQVNNWRNFSEWYLVCAHTNISCRRTQVFSFALKFIFIYFLVFLSIWDAFFLPLYRS